MARFALLLLVGSHVGRQEMTEGHFVTLLQHERLAAPVDAPSARVSARGGHVVFTSYARLVPDDPNQLRDVYVFNLSTATLTLESAGRNGVVANGESGGPDISGDGRYVVFVSSAGNLTDPQIPPGVPRVYLRDREAGTTRLLATSVRGGPANGYSSNPVISTDGTTVAFESAATDLVTEPDDAGRTVNVYWMRWPSGQRARVSLTSTGHARAGQSVSPSLSADGRYVAFMSTADLTCVGAPPCVAEAPDTNRRADVYLRDTQAGTTRRLTPSDSGGDANAASYHPAISADGRYVAFVSEASNLTRDSRSRVSQVFVHDTVRAVTELVSRAVTGRPGNGGSTRPAISGDGATIAFQSLASNLGCQDKCRAGEQDSNLLWDVYIRDQRTGHSSRVSRAGPDEWMETSRAPSLDASGRVIAFASRHPRNDLDDGHDEDLFIRLSRP